MTTLSKLADYEKQIEGQSDQALFWIDRGNAGIAIAYMLYALVLAVLAVAYQVSQLPQDQ